VRLPVGLSHALNLVLLLDSIAVGGTLGSVDELLSEALSDGLDVAESSLASTGGEEVDSLVDATQRRHVDGLAAHHTSGTNAARILASTGVDHSIDDDLDWVLAGEEGDDVAGVLHDAHCHDLLAVVTAVHHEGVGDALHDRALSLLETLLAPAASGVRQVDCVASLSSNVLKSFAVAPGNLCFQLNLQSRSWGGSSFLSDCAFQHAAFSSVQLPPQ